MRTHVLIAAIILLLLPHAARGSGAPSLRAAIAKNPPVIDGELSDEEWAGAAHFSSFVQFEPHRGNPAREKTEAYFLYDEGHLYFAFQRGTAAFGEASEQGNTFFLKFAYVF
ncbi:MAG: hypothetical protein V3R60_05900 [Acidobacteriota bacterium]